MQCHVWYPATMELPGYLLVPSLPEATSTVHLDSCVPGSAGIEMLHILVNLYLEVKNLHEY